MVKKYIKKLANLSSLKWIIISWTLPIKTNQKKIINEILFIELSLYWFGYSFNCRKIWKNKYNYKNETGYHK